MKRIWLIVNPASGSTSEAVVADFDRAAAALGLEQVGRTTLPADELPDGTMLTASGCDTLIVFGGDGTINAATTKVDDWPGECLVLPGGTMNMLPKQLHGDAEWNAILAAAGQAETVTLPVAAAGDNRAMCGVIAGPASAWVHARERVREGAWGRVIGAAIYAARKMVARTIRVHGVPGHDGRRRAVILTPSEHGLEIASISTSSWFEAARIGWKWVMGAWRSDPGVDISVASEVMLSGRRTVSALFDGEPVKLPSPVIIRAGHTRLRFIRTVPA